MEQTEVIQLGEPNGNPPATTKQKRKPVRRDPEKRRLQNIQAQKKYRKFMSLYMYCWGFFFFFGRGSHKRMQERN